MGWIFKSKHANEMLLAVAKKFASVTSFPIKIKYLKSPCFRKRPDDIIKAFLHDSEALKINLPKLRKFFLQKSSILWKGFLGGKQRIASV